jgi:DNA adenine methylase
MSRALKIHPPLPFSFHEVITAVADQNKPTVETMETRPFIKWVGGKRSILPELMKRMPEHYGTYREAFIGGGALFFGVQPGRAYLSDINFHLILTYQAVRDDVDGLIALLKGYQANHTKENYLKARIRLSAEKDATKIAALFIYLNKTGFNGLYRVNKAGGFNVPMGSYTDANLFEEDVLRNDSKLLQGVTISQHGFAHCPIAREDFFYLDPPYHELYSQYDGSGFGEVEHKKLAEFCNEIHTSGAFFMLSNSDTDFVRQLYRRFHIEEVSAARTVSCKAHQRGRKNELIIRNYQ